MRVIVIKQANDLQALRTMLFKTTNEAASPASDAAMERIKALNPHVDFQRITANTTLLLPDDPAIQASDSRSVADDAFADFSSVVGAAFKTVAERMRVGAEAQAAEGAAVTEALRDPAVAKQLGSDRVLKTQMKRAVEAISVEQKKAEGAAQQIDAMRTMAAKELRALRELLG